MPAPRRSGLKKEMFGYVPGGYARILTRMQDVLERAGATIRLNSRVTAIRKAEHGVTVKFADGSSITPDQAVFTGPATTAAELCPELTTEEQRLLRGIKYQGIICASLLLKRPLTPYYVTNITDTVQLAERSIPRLLSQIPTQTPAVYETV